MSRRVRSFLRNTSGAAAIELAISIVPLIVLLFGGITYGGVFASQLSLEHAASEGARAGVAGITLCERKARAESAAQNALASGSLSGSAVIEATATAERIRVDIGVDYAANPLTPAIFPVPQQLTASVVVLTDGPELPAQSC